MEHIKTFTHTEEGKDILRTLSNIISTQGMEVYECWICEEKFAGRPSEVDELPECGRCTDELAQLRRDEYGLENTID